MKAISLWEPWASAIARGAKKIETRSWATKHRGPIAIHAALTKRLAWRVHESTLRPHLAAVGILTPNDLHFGCMVAVADLTEVVPTDIEHAVGIAPGELALGDYGPGRFAWHLDNVQRLVHPMHWKGRQGFFEVTDELLQYAKSPAANAEKGNP